MCWTPWNCPICYGEGFGPRCEHKPGCHYVPEPTFLERWEAAKTPWEQVRVMEGEWNAEAMIPEIGRAAVTLVEINRWARKYCEGKIHFHDFAAALPAYLDPQETITQYIDDEEASHQRMRDEAHRLTRRTYNPQAALMPQHLKGKVRVSIIGPDGKPQQIAETDKISFGPFPGKTVGICKCDIKNLTSIGHDSGCPEKKP